MLGERFDPRANALNSLRFMFATAVIVAHSFDIGGFEGKPRLGDFDLGQFAVVAFFVASGYLVTQSRERNSLYRFAWARFLRIYPGFWVCLILTAFAFAPIAGSIRGGWNISDALSYVFRNVTIRIKQFNLGGTLAGAPYPGAWNGSLWTLYYELGCYVLIGLFLCVRRFRQGWWVSGLFLLVTLTAILGRLGEFASFSGKFSQWQALIPFFLAGSVVYIHRYSISMSPMIFALACVIIIGSTAAGWGSVIAPLPLAYCVMWLGAELPQIVERIGDGKVDISYGMYIYAFPMQQLIVLAGVQRWGVTAMITLSVAATILPAALSWYLVEKPCLRLKAMPWPLRDSRPKTAFNEE